MTIVHDYLSYTKKWKQIYGEKTLVLIQMGSFFEVYALRLPCGKLVGSNIEDFSRINDMHIAAKNASVTGPIDGILNTNERGGVVIAGFGLTQYDKYMGKLQEKGYTIVVYEQDFPGKNATRSLSEIISPGTFFNTDNLAASNVTMCIWLEKTKIYKKHSHQLTVGISWIDIYTGKTYLSQFNKEYSHNPCTYDELERLVAINNPTECILLTNINDKYLEDITHYANINCLKLHKIVTTDETPLSECAERSQKQNYQTEVFNKFYPRISLENMFSSLSTHYLSMQSFTFLLDFIYKQNPNLVNKLSVPTIEISNNSLVLANHSLQQLNIIDEGKITGKLRSVSDLLNNCLTTMGKRSFQYKLHNPITNFEDLQSSYDITEHLLEKKSGVAYREMLSDIHDIEKLKRKIILKKATPKDLSIFAKDLNKVISLYDRSSKDADVHAYIKKEIEGSISPFEMETVKCREINELCEEIIYELNKTFYLDKCMMINSITPESLSSLSQHNIAFIKPGISETIDNLLSDCFDSRTKLVAISEWFSLQIAKIEKPSKLTKNTSYVKIHETCKSDPMLMGTKRRITLLQSILEKESSTDKKEILEYINFNDEKKEFIFSWDELEYVTQGSNKKDLIIANKEIRTLASNIQTAESKLISEIILFYKNYANTLFAYGENITYIAQYVTSIDIMQCKAYIANKYNYCKPILQKKSKDCAKSYFNMKDIRHPLIEHLQTNELYVPNDVSLGDISDGILLYGTNAVGKTSLIKAIGINVIMAQAGLYVACSEMKYAPYHAIFTRILGNDNIFKGLSTFEVEMSELNTILKMADKNSLILGDELCSGTESDSALSIFTASLDCLHRRNSTFLFATHFHEIQHYDEIKKLTKLKSMHMEVMYDREQDMLVYDRKLKEGSGDSMYGLEVCKSLHLPSDFLEYAHSIRTKYNNKTKNILEEKGSHFNTKKLGGICEMCREERAIDTHHLQHQSKARKDNAYIKSFHKNHKANLMNLCEECHHKIHEADTQYKRVKTNAGYILKEVRTDE